MIRHSLLVVALAVTAASAQPLQFGPAKRVAPLNTGTPGRDYQGTLAPGLNNVFWLHAGELWSEPLAGSPPRPDTSNAHSLGVSAGAVVETVNGPLILYTQGDSTFVRSLSAPASAGNLVAYGDPDGIECNATRCLASTDQGNFLAIVDFNGQVVYRIPPGGPAHMRLAWATDPNGFLLLLTTGYEDSALSIDNNGNIRANVTLETLYNAATTFNGDRYAIFTFGDVSAGVTGFTLTPDGVPSARKKVFAGLLVPQAVVWNGSEDLLIGATDLVGGIPEGLPVMTISGLRIAPDLTPIDARPFLMAPRGGKITVTSTGWNRDTFYAVWTRSFDPFFVSASTPTTTTVEGAAVSAAGDVVTRDLLSWGSVPQTSPRVAQGTSSSVVVWSEFDIQTGINALRYARNGQQAFTGATGTLFDVVPLGDDYLITWVNGLSVHAAILSSDGRWSEVALPAINYANVYVAANRDHWLIAGGISPNIATVVIARDGTASPPTIIPDLPYVYGLASDGDHFFLASMYDLILDGSGKPITQKSPNRAALEPDFAGGVYGALGPLGSTFDRYDRDGNFLGSTKYAISGRQPFLFHIGSRFVIVDAGSAPLATIVAADGTVIASGIPVPAITIARSDGQTSTAVESHYVNDAANRPTPALFVEPVSIPDLPPHRAVKH